MMIQSQWESNKKGDLLIWDPSVLTYIFSIVCLVFVFP